MYEDIKPEIGARFPERTQRLVVERLSLQLGRNDHAREAKLDGAALELGHGRWRIERGHMTKTDEAAG